MTGAVPPAARLTGIQYLRGIAATMVVLHHVLEESYGSTDVKWRSPDWLTTFGAAGVDIFFVISGLVMLHASFPAGNAERPLTFVRKRLVRIFPLYWLCLVGLLACWVVGFYKTLAPTPFFMLRNAVLWPGERMALGVSWTLSYELYFYAIFAIMLASKSRKIALIGSAACLGLGLAIAQVLPDSEPVRRLADPIALEFVFGLAIAYFLPRAGNMPKAAWLAVPAFAVIIASPMFVTHASTNGLTGFARLAIWGTSAAGVVLAFTQVRPASGWLHRLAMLTGDASYSIYLTHPFLMLAYAWLLRHSGMLRDMAQPPAITVVFLACIAFGVGVHLLVERPLMKRLARNSRRTDIDRQSDRGAMPGWTRLTWR